MMSDGRWLPVERVAVDDSVAAYEDGAFVSKRVLACRSSGVDDVLCVRTERKSLRVNAKHPFLLESGLWKKAGELAPGDRVTTLDAAYGASQPAFDPWFFGFLMGDGWVTTWARNSRKPSGSVSKSRSWCVCVAASVYPDLNQRVAQALEAEAGRPGRLTKFGYYRVESNTFGRKLVSLGLVGGAHGKRIPEWVFRLSREDKIAYLRGYVDADGNTLARTHDSHRVASVSRNLIEDTRLLAISAGLRCGRVCSFKQRVQAPHSKEPKDYECFTLVINFSRLPDRFETVVSVEPDGRDEVFDITVDGAENFVAGGFVVHNTRWHPDDLTGHALRDHAHENWELIKLPALNERGESLWPERWSAAALESKRLTAGEYEWASQFMGEPRPRGDSVFRGCTFYDNLPVRFRIGKGIDLASTAKTRADWSCGIVLLQAEDERGEPLYYVADVQRAQAEVPSFVKTLDAMTVSWPGPWHWFCSTTEKGTAQLLTSLGIYVDHELAVVDKFVRAGPVAAAWNAGRILVPRQAPWLKAFVDELGAFIGKGDRHDDQVDALASAFATLGHSAGKPRNVTGDGSRWGDDARGWG